VPTAPPEEDRALVVPSGPPPDRRDGAIDVAGLLAGPVLPTSVRLVVRVAGVLPPPPHDAVVAELRCGDQQTAVELDPARLPDTARSERLVLGGSPAPRCTAGLAGADGPAPPSVRVDVGGERLAPGTRFAFWPDEGEQDDVVLTVTYGGATGPAVADAAAPAEGPGADEAGGWSSTWAGAGLAATFAAGLAGSIWASRRKTWTGPQEPPAGADS
jgi:hypothetical protein